MLTTKRLFDELPSEMTCEAVVTHVSDDFIILDQTLFYPLSGNQDFDVGFIDGHTVSAVHIQNNQDEQLDLSAPIMHFTNTAHFKSGQNVRCEIDKVRRLNIMRLHTASHLVENCVKEMPDFLSVEGSFVNAEKDRTDYYFSQNIDSQSLGALELQVNEFISQAHPISFVYRDGLRIWCCNGIEVPCCGTHVSNTAEVGKIRLSRKNKGKGLNRIEIKLL